MTNHNFSSIFQQGYQQKGEIVEQLASFLKKSPDMQISEQINRLSEKVSAIDYELKLAFKILDELEKTICKKEAH